MVLLTKWIFVNVLINNKNVVESLFMDGKCVRRYSVDLSIEEICLLPFKDILILGKKTHQGKIGVSKSFECLWPNTFEAVDIDNDAVETVFINKKLLKKMNRASILRVLKEKVLPGFSPTQILKIDFKIKIFCKDVQGVF